MKQTRKGKRRNRSPASKKERRKRAVKALAAAGVIAGGTYAYAEPVRFDNPPHGEPGHFHWPSDAQPYAFLDVMLPAESQPGYYYDPATVRHVFGGGVATWGSYAGLGIQGTSVGANGFALGLNAGDEIPNPSGICSYYYDSFCFATSGSLHYPGYDYGITEGVPKYLGVAIGGSSCQYDDTCTYGWIGVVRTGAELEAFAWGHETEQGVPIEAGAGGGGPEPIPTMSEYGLMAMGLGMLATGAWLFRKKLPKPEPA